MASPLTSHTSDEAHGRRQLTAVLVALAAFVGTVLVMPWALYWGLMQCDELCEANTGWRANQGAWQWRVQLVLALIGFAAAAWGVRRAWRTGWLGLLPAAMIAVVAYGAWVAVVRS